MKKSQFRPHHIFCARFLKNQFPERGAEFQQVMKKREFIFEKNDEHMVEVIQGIDKICRACTNLKNDRCESPEGNEEAVRKWDHIILKGLGVSYGETMTSKDWRMLIEKKAPLDFCKAKCQWKPQCTASGQNGSVFGCCHSSLGHSCWPSSSFSVFKESRALS